MNYLPGYDTWKTATPYDDDGPEPSDAHTEEAFAQLVSDDDLLSTFIMDEQPNYTTVFQLQHRYGLPNNDGTERDDNLCESYEVTFRNFFEHYRDWLGDRLTRKAEEVMRAEIEQMRADAEEAAAESRMEFP